MFAFVILFCLLNFAASISVNSQTSVVEVNKGTSVQLKWQISISSGESYISGNIKLQPPGKQEINIGVFQSEFAILMYPDYSSRRWSATHLQNSNEVVLNIEDAKEKDDGGYVLDMQYISSGVPKSSKETITLHVLVKPYYPLNSYDSGSKTFDEGNQVTIKCQPEGSPKPIKIIWEKNNVRYKETDTNNPDLVFDNVTRHDIGTYVCKANNKAGSADTNPTTQLIIRYKPVNTKFNATKALLLDMKVNLQCSAEADPKAVYSISGGAVSEVRGSKTGTVTITVGYNHDGKTVSCTPSNDLGNGPTVHLLLDVKVGAKVIELDKEINAIEGRNKTIECRASGKPAAKIIWLKDGVPLKNMPSYAVSGRHTDNTFLSVSTLILAPVKREDSGNYGCQAINRYVSDTKTVTLILMYLPEVTDKTKQKFREREKNLIRKGDNVELDCEAVGNPPTAYYVWRWENGTVIQNKTTGILAFQNIQTYEGGRLYCAGGSYIGEGKKESVNVFVRVPPRIDVAPQQKVWLNESQRLQLFCNATGVPEPTIHWTKDGEIIRVFGTRLSIPVVTYKDRGTFTCTADNGISPNVSASSNVIIYFRPVIQTTSAIDTLLGAESGQEVTLVCTADALPVAQFKWFTYPSMQERNKTLPDIIDINQQNEKTIVMKVRARFGAKYLCYVYNNRGNDTQIYEIRPKGPPEAPYLDTVETFIFNEHDKLSEVHAYLKWIPGYNGGQSVWYKVFYGLRADQTLTSTDIDDECNCFKITQDLEANKDYVFYVQAYNKDGPSNSSNHVTRRTKAFYGTASVERLDFGKIVKVSFVIYTKENLTKQVRFREKKEDISWETRNTDPNIQVPLVIEDLDPERHYIFQVLWRANGKEQITAAGEVAPWTSPNKGERSGDSLTREEIIAVIAGVGGFILIVILILFLCLIRKRHKPKRDETVVVMRRQPQTGNVLTRRSLIGSVEDDPFVSAHDGTQEKKKTRDSYYLPDSEDMNTFASEDVKNPAENSQAYQPFKSGQKSRYNDEERSSSDDESFRYTKQRTSDDELSSELGYEKLGKNEKLSRDNTAGLRERTSANHSKINKRNNNNRPVSNGRGAPPPYRPRSTADTPLPPYPDDHLDLDDPSTVPPFDDPLPPPMPVLPNSRSIPENNWNDRYSEEPTLQRNKSSSHGSLGSGKPYINAQGKLVRPSSRHSSSDHFSDSEQRLPEPEVPTGRPRQVNNDDSNLVSYLV